MFNRGKVVIVGIVGVAIAAAAFSTWYHYRNQHRALDFWGPSTALLIADAPEVEIKQLEAGPGSIADDIPMPEVVEGQPAPPANVEFDGLAWQVTQRKEARQAKGMSNVRRALVLDTTFDWKKPSKTDEPEWQYALQTSDGKNWATVLFDFDTRQVALTGGKRAALLDPEANEDLRQFFAEQFPDAPVETAPAESAPAESEPAAEPPAQPE